MPTERENLAKLVDEAARLTNDLAEATNEYLSAKARESAARSDTTNALNRLNELQKDFDSFVGAAKKASPPGSDWSLTRRGQVFAAPDPEHS